MPPTMASTRRKPPARGYHHGDLKNALRDAASMLIAERGVEAVSLREISQAAGVSHTAAYRHYADKQALLAGRRIPVPVVDDAFVEHMAEQCVALLMRGLAR